MPYDLLPYRGQSICIGPVSTGHHGKLSLRNSCFPPIAKKPAPPLADSLAFITRLSHSSSEGVAVPVRSSLRVAVGGLLFFFLLLFLFSTGQSREGREEASLFFLRPPSRPEPAPTCRKRSANSRPLTEALLCVPRRCRNVRSPH